MSEPNLFDGHVLCRFHFLEASAAATPVAAISTSHGT
jgi:hypothetical protein